MAALLSVSGRQMEAWRRGERERERRALLSGSGRQMEARRREERERERRASFSGLEGRATAWRRGVVTVVRGKPIVTMRARRGWQGWVWEERAEGAEMGRGLRAERVGAKRGARDSIAVAPRVFVCVSRRDMWQSDQIAHHAVTVLKTESDRSSSLSIEFCDHHCYCIAELKVMTLHSKSFFPIYNGTVRH